MVKESISPQEPIESPKPLSSQEEARVRDNAAFLLQKWRDQHVEWIDVILQAVDKTKSDQAPNLPETLWPVLKALQQTREQLVDFLIQASLQEEARRRITPLALGLARDRHGHYLNDPSGADDIECC